MQYRKFNMVYYSNYMSNQVTVLVVEDDTLLLTALKDKLDIAGYTTNTAVNGIEGLRKALETRPGIILLDMLIPEMDGMTMLKKLREDAWGKDVPVIVFSNVDPDGKLLSDVMETKPTYYMLKSNSSLETVLEKIEEILNPLPVATT